jgi:signal transduction histidine kinase
MADQDLLEANDYEDLFSRLAGGAPVAELEVLIVGGSESQNGALAQALDDAHASVAIGATITAPEEGLRHLGSGRYDIAFVSRNLSGGGAALIRNAGGRLCATPMVLMGRGDADAIEAEALDAGAVDFLDLTDMTPAMLRRIVRYARFSHRMTRELIVDERRHRAEAESAFAANAEKTRFLAQMSHELRTPLNAILGFSDVVRNEMFGPMGGTAGERYREYLDDIHASGSHLLNLINDLLDLSKIEAGRMELSPEEFPLPDMFGDVERMTRPQAERQGVNFDFRTNGVADIRADRRLLTQAVLNIVANAVKFTPAGGTVALSVGREGRYVILSVKDTGPGIEPADLKRVLEPFGQAGRRKAEGTGLGLPLARSIMECHGGGLEIESEAGNGTTVSLWLPVA